MSGASDWTGGGAALIVAGDRALLALGEYAGARIVTLAARLETAWGIEHRRFAKRIHREAAQNRFSGGLSQFEIAPGPAPSM